MTLSEELAARVDVYAHDLGGKRVRIASGIDRGTAEVIRDSVERGSYAPYVPPVEIK